MIPQLTIPRLDLVTSYIAALREGLHTGGGEMTEDAITALDRDHIAVIDGLTSAQPLTYTRPDGTVVPRVPQTILWLTNGQDMLGSVNIRHYLNDHLRQASGNIGYGIRPSRHQQGLGKLALRLALEFCRTHIDLDQVLLTCNDDNLGSIGVIEGNGGILEKIATSPFNPDMLYRYYWIKL